VGHQKNELGLMCLMSGLYLFGELLRRREEAHQVFTRQHKIVAVILAAMLIWLLHMSDSQTSVACLLTAVAVLLLGRMPFMARRPSGIIGVLFCAALVIWLLNDVLHLKEFVLSFLGRNPTLTNRTEVWQTLEAFAVNPVVGTGFMSFWTGERLERVWRLLGAGINQAHNGYLEQYLNLGYIGVAFIVIIMLSGLLSVRRHLNVDPAAGMMRLCFIVSAALYNFTEASFYGMSDMWVLLLLGCLEVPGQSQVQSAGNSWSAHQTMQGKARFRAARIRRKELLSS